MKPQAVRLADVFLLGPFMVWYGLRTSRDVAGWQSTAMVVAGLATIAYNWRNFKAERERARAALGS